MMEPVYTNSNMQTVYFHGFSGDSDGLRALAQAMPYKNYHLYTLPGFQNRPMTVKERDDIRSYVDRIVLELSEQFPGQEIHLIGHSHGAMIGFAVAAHRDSQVKRLTLINPVHSPRVLSRLTARVTMAATRASGNDAVARVLRKHLFVDIASRHMTKHETQQGKALVRDIRRKEANYYTKDMLLLARHVKQFRKQYAHTSISIPTTIVYGEKDNVSGARDHTWYRNHCLGDVRVLKHEGGHLRVITQPDEVGAILSYEDIT
jgi:pimeloyl-ACP methyl ester carboxylesterase